MHKGALEGGWSLHPKVKKGRGGCGREGKERSRTAHDPHPQAKKLRVVLVAPSCKGSLKEWASLT